MEQLDLAPGHPADAGASRLGVEPARAQRTGEGSQRGDGNAAVGRPGTDPCRRLLQLGRKQGLILGERVGEVDK
jgi:hypothetical protein